MKLIRIFALLLSTLLLFSLLGCEKIDLSGGKNNGGNQNNDFIVDTSDPKTLTVKTTVSGEGTFRPEGGASPKTDRILAQIEAVEKSGYAIDVEIVSEESLTTAFLRACRAGKKYADVIQTDAMFLSRYYDKGYFLSLPQVGLEVSSTGTLKKSDGTPYALRADGWNNPLPTLSYLLFYNEKLFTDSGCETPLELYEAGSWNWVNFERLCKEITNATSGEVYAIAHPTDTETDLVWATLHAAGLTYFSDDGVCTMDSEEGLKGFSALRSLLSSGVTYRLGSYENGTADATAKLAFTNRRTAFLVENSSLLFETGDDSLPESLGEDLRIIGFPSIQRGVVGATYTQEDIFCGITSTANKELCKTVLPLLFEASEGISPNEMIEDYFYHEEDGELYFDLLATADTDTSLAMTENRSLVEEYFMQVANGASAKEILSNFQIIFNSQKKG